MRETRILEFKEMITNTFLKTVSAFSNYDGGTILFGVDDDGNVKGLPDVKQACLDIENKINEYFKQKGIHINLKYVDPSYQVRSSVTTANDSIYCERLGSYAVHAAMAGKTKMVVGLVNGKYVHIPIKMVTMKRNFVDPEGALWRDALDATRQPILMVNNFSAVVDKYMKDEQLMGILP